MGDFNGSGDLVFKVARLGVDPDLIAYRRIADVQEAPYDGALILFNPNNRRIVSLNASAAALWEALIWPHTTSELAQLLHEAAPSLSIENCAEHAEGLIFHLLLHDFLESLE